MMHRAECPHCGIVAATPQQLAVHIEMRHTKRDDHFISKKVKVETMKLAIACPSGEIHNIEIIAKGPIAIRIPKRNRKRSHTIIMDEAKQLTDEEWDMIKKLDIKGVFHAKLPAENEQSNDETKPPAKTVTKKPPQK